MAEKQLRVSCQESIGNHISTGCRNAIHASENIVMFRGDGWNRGTRSRECGMVLRFWDRYLRLQTWTVI